MDYSVTFARHFARLLWLLLHEPANTDEQKASLRALVTVGREGFVILASRGDQLTANGTALPLVLSGVSDVVARMASHGVRTIDVSRDPVASDLLAAARMLAGEPGSTPSLGRGTVKFGGTPAAAQPAITHDIAGTMALPDMDFGEVLVDPLVSERERASPARPMRSIPQAAPHAGRGGGGLFDHFSASRAAGMSESDLLAQFDAERNPDRLVGLLDNLATRAEGALQEGRHASATEIVYRIVRRERDVQELDIKRAFVLTMKRLAKAPLLRAVVADLARAPGNRDHALAVLARAGEDGADALIEQLAAAEGRADRRAFYDALVHLQAGIPTLMHMLGDPRWYVARNAAALLGEMQAREAEQSLLGVLHHDDERVRHAATVAVMRLGISRSLPIIQQSLKDRAPHIRMQAAAALVGRRESNVTALLLRALDDERDEEVQAAFLIALGRVATPEAVQRLIATAEADKGLFRRKPVTLRVAAVQALSEARTPEALDALATLQADKDEDVRATAVYALGRRPREAGDGG